MECGSAWRAFSRRILFAHFGVLVAMNRGRRADSSGVGYPMTGSSVSSRNANQDMRRKVLENAGVEDVRETRNERHVCFDDLEFHVVRCGYRGEVD